jgi:hypothetical protein
MKYEKEIYCESDAFFWTPDPSAPRGWRLVEPDPERLKDPRKHYPSYSREEFEARKVRRR